VDWDDLSKDELLSRFLQMEERIDELEKKLERKDERIEEQQEWIEELETRLRKYENPHTPPSKRRSGTEVLAAIGRKKGDQLDTLADRHGVVEKTIRNWLDRFEEEPIEQAPYDAPRPGGPAKIEGGDHERLFEQLQQPPTELGYDQQAWSAKLLLHHAKEEYGVEYHETYAYDLLKEAGLSLRTARPQHHEADPEEKAEFQETVEKNGPN